MNTEEEKRVAVIGAGLVGSLLSLGLAKRGFKVDIIEKRGDYRHSAHSEGKSINLALSTRGLTAINYVGGEALSKKVKDIGIPVYGRMIHSKKKTSNAVLSSDLEFQQYGVLNWQHLMSISRGDLNDLLLDECEKEPGVRIHFNETISHVDLEKTQITVQGTTRQYEMIFGSDGVYSSLRNAMQHNKGFNFSQQYLDHGYKELLLPADPNYKPEESNNDKQMGHLMDSHSLHIWPRGKFMLMGLPNLDRTYTITLFLPHTKFEELEQGTDRGVVQFFEDEFPDFLSLIGPDRLVKQFRANPVGSLLTIQASPYHKKKVCTNRGCGAWSCSFLRTGNERRNGRCSGGLTTLGQKRCDSQKHE